MKRNHQEKRQMPRISRALSLPLLSVALFLVVEGLNKGGIVPLARFIWAHPYVSAFNVLIILATLLFSELFPRRRAVLLTLSILWLGIGITNHIMINFRVQPFTFADVVQLADGIAIMPKYFNWIQIVLIFALGFLAVAGIVLLFTKLKKQSVNPTRSAILFAAAVISCFLCYTLSINFSLLPRRFDNLVVAFEEYGFPYCFVTSVSQSGIDKPQQYSGERVEDILGKIDDDEESADGGGQASALEGAPNVLFLQLESFFDVHTIRGVSFSEDPIPVFSSLLRDWPSGEIYVPAVGGGTANTEFEVLTGMNLDFFGAGEYPYNTVLKETTCETVCQNLAAEGYATTAIHNYTATFYDRGGVYSRLGFEHFVSLEYMPDATYNAKGWCQDSILTGEIEKAMRATDARDFIFAITVQTHGKYDDAPNADSTRVALNAAPEGIYEGQLMNYANALERTDAFLGELLTALSAWDEPVVVVMYGDHLPAVGLNAQMLEDQNLYETQYVVWNNYGASFTAENTQAYQLSARILKQLGIEGGVFCRYHQNEAELSEADYLDQLEMLEYDVLYGDMEVYGGENPYASTDLKMGSEPITVSDASIAYGRLLVKGENFTECSVICLGGDALADTLYVDKNTLVAKYAEDAPPDSVCVVQKSIEKGTELSRSNSVAASQP